MVQRSKQQALAGCTPSFPRPSPDTGKVHQGGPRWPSSWEVGAEALGRGQEIPVTHPPGSQPPTLLGHFGKIRLRVV